MNPLRYHLYPSPEALIAKIAYKTLLRNPTVPLEVRDEECARRAFSNPNTDRPEKWLGQSVSTQIP
jgi:hypothetical protein